MFEYERDTLLKYTYQKLESLNKRISLIEDENRLLREQNDLLKTIIKIQNGLLGNNQIDFLDDNKKSK